MRSVRVARAIPMKDSETTVGRWSSWAKELRAMGLRVSIAIRDGQPQDVLFQEARELSADCIFIDSHGLGHESRYGVDRRGLGKVAEALVLGAHCSVEVVRAKNFSDQSLKPAA